jgi:hypothetical protein
MSQPCAITKCNRASRGLCDCCKQNLCLQHLTEHNASLVAQLNPLTDEINALGDRLRTLNIQKIAGHCRQKLEQWRLDCHQKIDSFFEQKCEELDRLVHKKVGKKREETIRVQSKMAELIHAQETTRQEIDSLTSTIRDLQRQIDDVEQICFQVNTRSLSIDNSFIHFMEMTEHEIDIASLSPVSKTIIRPPGSYKVMTSNDRYLLMHRNPNLCFVDQEMNVVKEVLWPYKHIHNMCWSSTLGQFIAIEQGNVFLIDENTLVINNVHSSDKHVWMSCTCSDKFLYLSTNKCASPVMEFSLLPSIELVKHRKAPDTCANDDVIHSIIYKNATVAMLIKNISDKSLRIELRSADTFNSIWSLRLDITCNANIAFDGCSLSCDEWLVVDYETENLLRITKDGNVKEKVRYDANPHCASLFGPNTLAISSNGGINFHKV